MIEGTRSDLARASRLKIIGLLVLLVTATFLVFLPALQNGFVSWDDDVYVTDNPRVQRPSLDNALWFFGHTYFRSYTPLAFVSHMCDYSLWGGNPFGHHLHTLILHSLNTGWVFLLALVLLAIGRRPGSLRTEDPHLLSGLDTPMLLGGAAAALAFGIHPLRAESASWISDRKDLLCAFFLLPSVCAYLAATVSAPGKRRRWIFISALLYLPALLSKSIATLAPLTLLLCDVLLIYPGETKRYWRRILLHKVPFLLLGAATALAAFSAIPENGINLLARDLSSGQRLLLPPYSVTFYLGKLFWPLSLAPVYDLAGVTTMALYSSITVLVTALVLVLWRLGMKSVPAAWFSFVLFLSPTVLFLSAGIQPLADRYTYIPSIALCLLLGAGVDWGWRRVAGRQTSTLIRTSMLAVLFFIFLGLGVVANRQTSIWKDSLTLWIQGIQVSPGVAAAYNGAGVALGKMGRAEESIRFFREALKLQELYPVAWNNLGIVLRAQGDKAEATESFRTAIRLQQEYADPYIYLGEMAEEDGMPDTALGLFRSARTADPVSALPYARLGPLFARLGQHDSAAAAFSALITLRPEDDRAYLELAKALEATGETDQVRLMMIRAAKLGNNEARRWLQSRRVPAP